MKQKKYRMETVLIERKRKKDEILRKSDKCRQELIQAENILNDRKNSLEQCQNRIYQADQLLNAQIGNSITKSKMDSLRNYLHDLKHRENELEKYVRDQLIIVRQKEKKLTETQNLLIEITREIQVIKQHKARWEASREIDLQKSEQRSNDEIASILFQKKDKSRVK